MTYWQTVAGFDLLAAGLFLWALAVGFMFSETDDEPAAITVVIVLLVALGCLAFAGAVHLL